MHWFYVINSEKQGPHPAARLAELGRSGSLGADDLVWREGLAEWRPFQALAGEIFAEASGGDPSSPVDTAVCAHSGRALPVAELVPYGESWIDPHYKEVFVQRLMEAGDSGATRGLSAAPAYVGFWWRALGWLVDYFVLLIPSMLCMLPYFIASFGSGFAMGTDPGATGALNGWTAAIVITYALGLLGQFAVNGGYHTWMTVKYQGTVGKMTIGAKIVTAGGDRVTTGRAFCRWLCLYWLNGIIWMVVMAVGFGIGFGILFAMGFKDPGSADSGATIAGVLAMLVFGGGGFVLGMFPYWMAGIDGEKRALHDRLCSTRVVKK